MTLIDSLSTSIIFSGILFTLKDQITNALKFSYIFLRRKFIYSITFNSSFSEMEQFTRFFSRFVCHSNNKTAVWGYQWESKSNIILVFNFENSIYHFKYSNKNFVIKTETVEKDNYRSYKLVIETLAKNKKDLHTLIHELESFLFNKIDLYVVGVDRYSIEHKKIEKRFKDSYIDNNKYIDLIISKSIDVLENRTKKACFLLEGVPGSGKTSLIHVIASELSLPIYYVQACQSTQLAQVFMNIPSRSIIVFEDIDGSNIDIDRTRESSKINLSSLLNCLDGLLTVQSSIIFLTTNNTLQMDASLLRKGRIDYTLSFKTPFQNS